MTAPTLRGLLAVLLLGGAAVAAHAKDAAPAVADPVLEARMLAIATELRCLVCQNETIAASHADLAVDLRQQVREMLQAGQTDQQIRDYMTARYGDFVLYRPPLNTSTVLLWAGPGLMLAGGLVALWLILRRRSRMPDALFESTDSTTSDDDDTEPHPGSALTDKAPHESYR